jgi:putative DNA primase/helicase
VRQSIDAEPDLDKLKAKWSDAGTLVTRRVSDVEAKPVCWLWPTRIPRGKLTIIAGDPGLGKSQITASVAAVVTRGGRWPVDRHNCDVGDVLFLSAEDDTADTLRPRLEAAGADLNRVHVIESVIAGYTGEGAQRNRLFSLQSDLEALGRTLEKLSNVVAVVIDPFSAYLGDADSHKNAEVRSLLAPLGDLSASRNSANHRRLSSKQSSRNASHDASFRLFGVCCRRARGILGRC